MELSLLLAKIFGIYFIIEGILLILRTKMIRQMVDDFVKSSPMVYIAGFVLTILGLILVLSHNVWAWQWELAITILSWLLLLKGVFYFFSSKRFLGKLVHTFDHRGVYLVGGLLTLVAGIMLAYVGFTF